MVLVPELGQCPNGVDLELGCHGGNLHTCTKAGNCKVHYTVQS